MFECWCWNGYGGIIARQLISGTDATQSRPGRCRTVSFENGIVGAPRAPKHNNNIHGTFSICFPRHRPSPLRVSLFPISRSNKYTRVTRERKRKTSSPPCHHRRRRRRHSRVPISCRRVCGTTQYYNIYNVAIALRLCVYVQYFRNTTHESTRNARAHTRTTHVRGIFFIFFVYYRLPLYRAHEKEDFSRGTANSSGSRRRKKKTKTASDIVPSATPNPLARLWMRTHYLNNSVRRTFIQFHTSHDGTQTCLSHAVSTTTTITDDDAGDIIPK